MDKHNYDKEMYEVKESESVRLGKLSRTSIVDEYLRSLKEKDRNAILRTYIYEDKVNYGLTTLRALLLRE